MATSKTIEPSDYKSKPQSIIVPTKKSTPFNSLGATNLFIEQITNLDDTDYGDFMRRANLYLSDLSDEMPGKNLVIHEMIEEMREYTQFVSSWEIEPTRSRLLNDAQTIRKLLNAVSGPYTIN